jgi:type II secretory pathway component GspD/PulD (secretin)
MGSSKETGNFLRGRNSRMHRWLLVEVLIGVFLLQVSWGGSAQEGEIYRSSACPSRGCRFAQSIPRTDSGFNREGEAKTLARPKVSAVSGKKASIEVVQELYFRTAPFFGPTPTQPTPIVPFFQLQAITAGVKLEIMPVIGAEGDILLEITPEVSSVVGITTEGLPQLATRKATATIWVREGQTVVLGGLRQREESKVTTKFPLISSLPLLGEIFKSHRKEVRESELIILLTPKLLEPRGM